MNTMTTQTPDSRSDADLSGRAKRLKAATNDTHDRLDHSIMDAEPFASRERYALFVTVQYQFHRQIAALYDEPSLLRLIPDLRDRCRIGLIESDLADLGIVAPASSAPALSFGREGVDQPTALGWLYVAEGSSLGAAFLLKAAQRLGLGETFGARHLGGAPEGRGLHWKIFTAALDAVDLSEQEEARVVAGARAAFARVQELTAALLAAPKAA